uniref:F-box domain-containing protein n=1 Tax=Tetradesmus obliquus TaxID=3088 RepID=A0A383V982_TETOB|eukprot:jgi/Sobl393_1/12008/SZX61309.1
MGVCFSFHAGGKDTGSKSEQEQQHVGRNELERLPQQLLVLVLSRLDQRELFGAASLVCKAWQGAAQQAAQQLQLNLSYLAALGAHPRFVQLMKWVHTHGQQLQQLHLCSSAPLGESNRRMLLRCLAPQPQGLLREPWPLQEQEVPAAAVLQLQQLTLQLDLEVGDVDFIADHVCAQAPMLQHLKLQPLKASLADLQLMVIACILGSLVGVDSLGPMLPHLDACSASVQHLAATATQLRSLSLSRYQVGSTSCISSATQLTALQLQHCGLTDEALGGLQSLVGLQRLELSDNLLSSGSCQALCHLTQLTHLDLSVMPQISRLRQSGSADISPLSKLTRLQQLNLVGFGLADVTPLSSLGQLSRLEAGLNPLSGDSLRVLGWLPALAHLELGGISQAWVLSSSLPPPEALRAHDACWYGLSGLTACTHLDLAGSNLSHVVWSCHLCPALGYASQLQRLILAHGHTPRGALVQLAALPGLAGSLQELSIDRCSADNAELAALSALSQLTRLSAAALSPKIGNKQAALLAQLRSLQVLCVRGNDLGNKGLQALAKGLPQLVCLDAGDNPRVSKRCAQQLAPLLEHGEAAAAREEVEGRFW